MFKTYFRPLGIILTIAASGILLLARPNATAAQDSDEAVRLHATASNLYSEAKNYELAAQQWQKLLSDHPDFSEARDVRLFLGLCHYHLQKYDQAAKEFNTLRESLDSLSDYRKSDRLLFFHAFCQFSLGQQNKNADQLNAALATYKQFFENYGNSDLVDQALYFQGETYYQLEKPADAAGSYQNLVENHKDSIFYPEAFYAWGVCLEELGQFADARDVYSKYQQQFPDDRRTLEVLFRSGDCLLQMAVASEKASDSQRADEQFTEASALFEQLAGESDFAYKDQALFHQAFCQLHLKQTLPAAQLYAAVAEQYPDSPLADQAALAAGKFFFSASKSDQAQKWLQKTVDAGGSGLAEAAHWLARIHIEQKRFDLAYDLASKTLPEAGESEFRVNLLMDCADALYEQEDKRKQSIKYYLDIVEEFPRSELAPSALYYAAFATTELGDSDEAIKLAAKFKRDYPESSYLPDTLQVQGEAFLKEKQYEDAHTVFESLVTQFPNHDSKDFWHTRVGWSLYLQDKFDETIDALSSRAENMSQAVNESESYYLIGASRFQLANRKIDSQENTRLAIADFNQAVKANPNRSNADEIRLLVARCHFQSGNTEAAINDAKTALENAPEGEFKDEVAYWLGEFAYQGEQFDEAANYYSLVIDSGRDSKYLANCLYGNAWALMQGNQLQPSIATFTELIDKFPETQLATDALIGRGMTRRKAQDFSGAVRDFDLFLATNPDEEKRFSAVYERGLALAGSKKWSDAITALKPLVGSETKPELADEILYELAWAFKEQAAIYKQDGNDIEEARNEKAAAEQFQALADDHPQSPHAGEAEFHVGQQLYADKDYQSAAKRYQRCLKAPIDDDIAEKAHFKLGWSYFQLKEYEDSLKAFSDQIEQFPNGSLGADGKFMVAESLYRDDSKHAEAVTAYKVAIDAVRESDTVREEIKMLAPIHAAQSANANKDFQTAIDFAEPLVKQHPDSPYAPDAWYEIGEAQKGLGNSEEAIAAWKNAQASTGKTGARARCMIGEEYFAKKDFDAAFNEFQLVLYGAYGNDIEVSRWKAFAAYEAARVKYVQIKDENDKTKRDALIADAKKMFGEVLKFKELDERGFPEARLIKDAREQIAVLEKLN